MRAEQKRGGNRMTNIKNVDVDDLIFGSAKQGTSDR